MSMRVSLNKVSPSVLEDSSITEEASLDTLPVHTKLKAKECSSHNSSSNIKDSTITNLSIQSQKPRRTSLTSLGQELLLNILLEAEEGTRESQEMMMDLMVVVVPLLIVPPLISDRKRPTRTLWIPPSLWISDLMLCEVFLDEYPK